MKPSLVLSVFIFCFVFIGSSKIRTLSDKNLDIRFNDQTALLKVTDIRGNKTWEQLELKDRLTVEQTTQEGNTINVKLSGNYNLDVIFTLTSESALEVEIRADKKLQFDKLTYPAAFQTPDKDHYVVFTDGEGFLLRADDTGYGIGRQIMHSMRGLSMPWIGITDADFKTGYVAIVDTPDDSEIWVKRYNGLISFKPLWISQKDKFGYNRKITYHFLSEGGYVAQCKKYRNYVMAKNSVPLTLTEKQKRFPAIEKMIGAVHIYVWDDARHVDFAREMKVSGIEKAFILWNPNHLPYPEYGYDTNPKSVLPLIPRLRTGREMKIYPHEPFFLDGYLASGIFEDYGARNPLTRTQYKEAVIEMNKFFEDKYNQIVGVEWGADYGIPTSAYAHGMMTLHHMLYRSPNREKKGTVYYMGDWRNPSRPSIMVGEHVADDYYLKWAINEKIRVPLYQLVYHDNIVTTWRWDDNSHNMPEIW